MTDSPGADSDPFEAIAQGLERDGYAVVDDGLPQPLAVMLHDAVEDIGTRQFHRARIGRGTDEQRNADIRRDRIFWLEPGAIPNWDSWADGLQNYLNRRLFLGLVSFESHFAVYDPGDFYRAHYDAFEGEANRVVSIVAYLNVDWDPADGGELLLHPDNRLPVRIVPSFGRLVAFMSEEVLHEVLPANRPRWSIAGWFRINTSIMERIDPAR